MLSVLFPQDDCVIIPHLVKRMIDESYEHFFTFPPKDNDLRLICDHLEVYKIFPSFNKDLFLTHSSHWMKMIVDVTFGSVKRLDGKGSSAEEKYVGSEVVDLIILLIDRYVYCFDTSSLLRY